MSEDLAKIAKLEATRAVVTHDAEQAMRKISQRKRKCPSVLVLGRDNFSDNSKYIYLSLLAKSPGYPAYWGTFNPDLYQELSRRKMPAINLAGNPSAVVSVLLEISNVVYCTNPSEATRNPLFRAALAGAYRFQLWHGIGLKHLDLQLTPEMDLLNPAVLTQLMGVMDVDEVLSPSGLYDDQWREAFGVERIFRAGMPRNEVLLRNASKLELINSPAIPDDFFKKGFILFAPTFTPRGAEPAWHDARLLKLLTDFVQSLDLGLIIKPHPFDRKPDSGEKSSLPPGTLLLDAGSDVYPILKYASAMITDTSSMASDFLLCDKPILFFRSKTIEEKSYPEHCMPEIPGAYVREESPAAFVRAWESIGKTADARNRLRQLYFETDPLRACEAIIGRIGETIGKT